MSVLFGGCEKIWSCCGVRLGSVAAPTTELQKAVKAKQVRDEPGVGMACLTCSFVEYCRLVDAMLSAFLPASCLRAVLVALWRGVARRLIAC